MEQRRSLVMVIFVNRPGYLIFSQLLAGCASFATLHNFSRVGGREDRIISRFDSARVLLKTIDIRNKTVPANEGRDRRVS